MLSVLRDLLLSLLIALTLFNLQSSDLKRKMFNVELHLKEI
jgi:hypothetical protein